MYYTIIILNTCAVQKVMTLVLSPSIGACVRVKFPVETYIYLLINRLSAMFRMGT